MAVPLASIVIVCFGRRDMTTRCLDSLHRVFGSRLGQEIELVLVDNGSPDDTLSLLEAWSDRARVIALPENRQFAGGCNAGGRAATGRAIVFLNNDTVMETGVIEGLAETVAEPGVAIAGPRLLYADGTIQHAGVISIRRTSGAIYPYHAHHRQDGALPAAGGVHEVDIVTGACLAINADVFAQLDGFDEVYVNGYEDVDLCLRARSAGHSIVYRGDLAFLHDEGASRGQGLNDTANQQRYERNWSPLLDPDDALAASLWGATTDGQGVARTTPSTPLIAVGQPAGLGSAADELRACLLAFEQAGHPAVAYELPASYTPPPLDGPTGAATSRALQRAVPQAATRFDVPPIGRRAVGEIEQFVRTVRATDPVAVGATAIAAVPGNGRWVPPAVAVLDRDGNARDDGILVALPTHRRRLTQTILAGLRDITDRPIRIVPTVTTRGLAAEIAHTLPDATLLAPCATDDHWAAAAQTASVAICADPDDGYDRRALVAAAAGAVPVAADGHGPAAAIVNDVLALTQGSVAAVIAASSQRCADAAREQVQTRCDPTVVGQRLAELIVAPVHSAA